MKWWSWLARVIAPRPTPIEAQRLLAERPVIIRGELRHPHLRIIAPPKKARAR